jgi:exoribonuclease II
VEKGTLIEFNFQNGERRLAIIERPEGKKHWIVIDERGQSHTIHPRQITYQVKGQTLKKPSDIPSFLQEVKAYLDPSSLEVAWEILVEEGENVDPAGLANLLYSDQSPALCYAAYCLLAEDKLYFKQKGEVYQPRSTAQVNEIKHQIAVETQKQREQTEFILRIKQRSVGVELDWESGDRQRLEMLEKYVISPDVPNRLALETLTLLEKQQTPESARQLLVDVGWWSSHENIFLLRSQIPVTFSEKVLQVAKNYISIQADINDPLRLDLTGLKVYTIDDESTTEIDDGISVETLPDGRQKLWIHIADPSAIINPGDELDLEARRRSTTLYLPTGMVPMFPPELATGAMSLIQGKICNALSFAVILDEQGAVVNYSIHTSIIKPTYRLTYEDVDEMLQLGIVAEPEIAAIADWSKRRQKWRESQGAVSISLPESYIKVDGEEITINLLDDAPSRGLVAEMMILAGEVAAHYAQTHQIPVPFRSQPQPELPSEEQLLLLPAGPVRSCALRGCMPRSEMGTTPARHAGLGLEMYTQVTSPIRRYSDLLAHFQIKAHLYGQPLPFKAEQIQEIMLGVGVATQEARLVERQTNRYWGLEYLRRNADQVWDALLLKWLREDDGLGLILLEELGLELAMRFNRSIPLGERLGVKVSHADPHLDIIHFREMMSEAGI